MVFLAPLLLNYDEVGTFFGRGDIGQDFHSILGNLENYKFIRLAEMHRVAIDIQ
jgi:hypothetical protein